MSIVKLHSKALFVVFHYNLAAEAVNLCIQHTRMSRFRTSDILTAKIMAAKKGCGASQDNKIHR